MRYTFIERKSSNYVIKGLNILKIYDLYTNVELCYSNPLWDKQETVVITYG